MYHETRDPYGKDPHGLVKDQGTIKSSKMVINEIIPQAGRKNDADKIRMELLPPELLFGVATVLTFGAKKYDARNWEKGMSWGRVFGALMRHMWAWWGGQGPTTQNFLLGDTDKETGYSHLWHAGCCLSFLIAYEERRVGTDDRLGAAPSGARPEAGSTATAATTQSTTSQQSSRIVTGP